MTEKAFLTPDEVLRVAQAHIVAGVDQHILATLMDVNPARVAEACVAIRWAMENHKTIYRHVSKAKKAAKARMSKPISPADGAGTTKFLTGDPREH